MFEYTALKNTNTDLIVFRTSIPFIGLVAKSPISI
jgi:hypothetical protein